MVGEKIELADINISDQQSNIAKFSVQNGMFNRALQRVDQSKGPALGAIIIGQYPQQSYIRKLDQKAMTVDVEKKYSISQTILFKPNKTSQLERLMAPNGLAEKQFFPFIVDEQDFKTAAAFVATSKSNKLSYLFQSILDKEFDNRVEAWSEKLGESVANGEYDNVNAILSKNPKLARYKCRIVYSGVTHVGYPLQLAIRFKDVDTGKGKNDGMGQLIAGYLRKLKNGRAELEKQYKEECYDGYKEDEKKAHAQDLAVLNKLAEAIAEAKEGDACEAAVAEFRNYFVPKGVVNRGRHFREEMIASAISVYQKNYKRFGGSPESPRNKLFWVKGVGFTLRYTPSCTVQAICQAIYPLKPNQNEKLARSVYCENVAYFPPDHDPNYRMGYEFAWCRDLPANDGNDAWSYLKDLQDFFQRKTDSLQELLLEESFTLCCRIL